MRDNYPELGRVCRTIRYAKSGPATMITLWLTNILLAEQSVEDEGQKLIETLGNVPGNVALVSNEVGYGIVPENALARRFRDEAGILNQRLAAVCDRVVLVTAGLPLILKDSPRG